MIPVTNEDLIAMAKVAPEIRGLQETASEWWLGPVGVDKSSAYVARAKPSWPCWRDGFSRPVRPSMRFRSVDFTCADATPGTAVVLTVPEDDRELWVGWVRGERRSQLEGWIAQLNVELQRLLALGSSTGR